MLDIKANFSRKTNKNQKASLLAEDTLVCRDKSKTEPPGYIFCGNHRSYLDPIFVMLALRPLPIRFMAKEEFFRVGSIARMASWVGAFPIARGTADLKSIKRTVAMLKRGEMVGIFPEGTRVRDGANRGSEIHEGVALIAHLSKADVIPFHLWGTEKIAPPSSKCWHFPKIRLTFGEPLSLNDCRYDGMSKEERFSVFAADCMDAVYSLQPPEVACELSLADDNKKSTIRGADPDNIASDKDSI